MQDIDVTEPPIAAPSMDAYSFDDDWTQVQVRVLGDDILPSRLGIPWNDTSGLEPSPVSPSSSQGGFDNFASCWAGNFNTVHSGSWLSPFDDDGSRSEAKNEPRNRLTPVRRVRFLEIRPLPPRRAISHTSLGCHLANDFGSPPSPANPWPWEHAIPAFPIPYPQYVNDTTDVNPLAIVESLTAGLNHLHSQRIVHGDIKPTNLLISPRGQVQLSDFGVSCVSTKELNGSAEEVGCLRYMAPEMVLYDERPTMASDVWAWGSTCYEILTKVAPFASLMTTSDIVLAFYNKDKPYDKAEPLVKGKLHDMVLWQLMLMCWAYDPGSRPKMKVVLDKLQKHLKASDGSLARL